jgi:Putative zinc-RING and/or ribbon
MSVVPSRVMNNWDFAPQKVARASLQEINLFFDKPIINLEAFNPRLFVFVQKLSLVKKIREDINHMIKYLCACRLATKEKILDTSNTGEIVGIWLFSETEFDSFFRAEALSDPVTRILQHF